MLEVKYTSRFKRDYKSVKKRPYFDEKEFEFVLGELMAQRPLAPKYRDHELTGRHSGIKSCRECHIKPDWLLVYKVDGNELILYLLETGTHSDVFG